MLNNWGWRIVFVFFGFAIFIFFLVYKTMNENIDLVAVDYYAQELKYQERIDRLNNAKLLSQNITLVQKNGTLKIQFPEMFLPAEISGNIQIFVPSNAKMDRLTNINADGERAQYISIAHLLEGLYIVKIIWQAKGKQYYYEQRMYK